MGRSERRAVILGASGAIGSATARRLGGGGCRLTLLARQDLSAAALKQGYPDAEVLTADLATQEGCSGAAAAILRDPRCDILVCTAGTTLGGAWPDQPLEDWHEGFALKLFGTVEMCRRLWPALRAASGTVMIVSGGLARTPRADFMIGGAVNAALANFAKSLANQGLRDDVNVTCILPGTVASPRNEAILVERARRRNLSVETLRDQERTARGTRREATPEDVASLIGYLSMPDARHLTGTSIALDGGEAPGYI